VDPVIFFYQSERVKETGSVENTCDKQVSRTTLEKKKPNNGRGGRIAFLLYPACSCHNIACLLIHQLFFPSKIFRPSNHNHNYNPSVLNFLSDQSTI
jgi:hypothetical protein